jgi:hypothetical protein
MNQNYKANERELVKVVTFFKRQSKKLIDEGKLGTEHEQVQLAVDRFVEQMDRHADARAQILGQREELKNLVKDNPRCPKCNTNDKLKLVGAAKNEKGWKCNRYKCRKCNIEFTWTLPNNPWDMIAYIEEILVAFKTSLASAPEGQQQELAAKIEGMEATLSKLKPVIDAHDQEYHAMTTRDQEMEKLIHEFKNSLLIEKIKMDTWENRKQPDKK